jgi:LAO/AO transport system kinase
VSSVAPVSGIDELVEALDAHRERLDVAARRLAARRASALADFAAEHGERGLRALGGRRAALRALDDGDPGADVPALVDALESKAGVR